MEHEIIDVDGFTFDITYVTAAWTGQLTVRRLDGMIQVTHRPLTNISEAELLDRINNASDAILDRIREIVAENQDFYGNLEVEYRFNTTIMHLARMAGAEVATSVTKYVHIINPAIPE